MFYNRFVELCQKNNLSPSKAATLIGFNRSSVSMWKSQGYTPRREILVKIADFFDVSIDYLVGKTEDTAEDSLSEKETEMLNFFRTASPELQDAAIAVLKSQKGNIIEMSHSKPAVTARVAAFGGDFREITYTEEELETLREIKRRQNKKD